MKSSNTKHQSRKTLSKQESTIQDAASRLEKEFMLREQSMAANLLALEENNAFLIELLKRMQQLNLKTANVSMQSEIMGIIDLIQSQINNKNWDRFETFYKHANNNFIQTLTSNHPDLSPSEKRLCMLLKMNLSTKEISDITLQNCKAIEMARHRLRKKFGLNRETNLQHYLSRLDG